jgi:hypothetical protein
MDLIEAAEKLVSYAAAPPTGQDWEWADCYFQLSDAGASNPFDSAKDEYQQEILEDSAGMCWPTYRAMDN